MKRIAIILGLLLIMVQPTLGAVPQKQQIGPVEVIGFSELTVSKNQVVFTGRRVYVHTMDGRLEAKAGKIVISYASGPGKAGTGALQTISLTGSVWLKTKPEPNRVTEATASRADVDWAVNKEAVLTGDVHIDSTDPSIFNGPVVVTADKATVSLKPDSQLAPGEQRLRIESTGGTSKIEFTPQESGQGKSANQNR